VSLPLQYRRRSSGIVALPTTDTEVLKQRRNALVASTSSLSVLMPSDIVALMAADAEVLKQRLNALVAAAAEEKAAAARRCILATRQLLDKEQATAADLEWQTAAKKLVPGSTSSSTTETVTLLRRTSTPSSPTSTSRWIP
jgi:deoxyribose-phosphate aldolase